MRSGSSQLRYAHRSSDIFWTLVCLLDCLALKDNEHPEGCICNADSAGKKLAESAGLRKTTLHASLLLIYQLDSQLLTHHCWTWELTAGSGFFVGQ